MMHRFLLCVVLLSLVASAQPDQRALDNSNDNRNSDNRNKDSSSAGDQSWSFGFGSEEGSSGSSYLGVDIADVTSERLSALKLKEEHGAEITMVDSDAPAGKAGLREHDVVLSLNGAAVESAAQLRRMIKEIPPGRVITLGISRDGQPQQIKVQLADRRKSMSWQPGEHEFKFEMPQLPSLPDIDLPVSVVIAHSSLRSGLMVENITPQLGEFFGVKNGKGVLIRSVEKGSRGEKAGFRAGDVIVKVNDQPVQDSSDFTHALRGSSSASASVTVMRDKHEQTLTLTLPPKKDSGFLLEDTFEIPDVTAETEDVMRFAGNELANLHPYFEELQKELKTAAEETARCMHGEYQKQQKEIQRQLKKQQEKLQNEQRKMLDRQRQMRERTPDWAEI